MRKCTVLKSCRSNHMPMSFLDLTYWKWKERVPGKAIHYALSVWAFLCKSDKILMQKKVCEL